MLNYDYTDNQQGFNCWNEGALKQYFNRKDVQSAIHIAEDWQESKDTNWEVCNDDLNENYQATYTDTFDLFADIIKRVLKLKKIVSSCNLLQTIFLIF